MPHYYPSSHLNNNHHYHRQPSHQPHRGTKAREREKRKEEGENKNIERGIVRFKKDVTKKPQYNKKKTDRPIDKQLSDEMIRNVWHKRGQKTEHVVTDAVPPTTFSQSRRGAKMGIYGEGGRGGRIVVNEGKTRCSCEFFFAWTSLWRSKEASRTVAVTAVAAAAVCLFWLQRRLGRLYVVSVRCLMLTPPQ
jgi:hypothetical protein